MLSAPVFGAETARPGTVNYVEGAAFLEGKQLNPHDVGSVEMNPGQILTTGTGKAEILLTPGVFLRVDDHSTVKMISPDITPTQVELDRGRAAVEVDQIFKQNDLEITDGGVTTHLAKDGYYEFDANPPPRWSSKARRSSMRATENIRISKQHHEMALVEGAREKPAGSTSTDAENSLYKWSSLRSQYLAEANNQIAGEYAGPPASIPAGTGIRTCGTTPSSAAARSGAPSDLASIRPGGVDSMAAFTAAASTAAMAYYGGSLLRRPSASMAAAASTVAVEDSMAAAASMVAVDSMAAAASMVAVEASMVAADVAKPGQSRQTQTPVPLLSFRAVVPGERVGRDAQSCPAPDLLPIMSIRSQIELFHNVLI